MTLDMESKVPHGEDHQLSSGKTMLAGFRGEWNLSNLGNLLRYEQPGRYIVKSTAYESHGRIPVLTAGKTFILGYTRETEGIFSSGPVVIFDDFTTASQYVDCQFKVKSSAMKILHAVPGVSDIRFMYELLQTIRHIPGDHKRYWISEYQKMEVVVPNLDEQIAIANVLSDVDLLLESLDKLITKKRAIKRGAIQQLWSKSRSWAEVEVKQVLIDHFCGPSPTCEERNIKGDEWGVLRTTCTTWESGWNWRSHKLLPRSYWGQDSRMVRIGDTIITKAGPRHRVGVPSFVDFIPNNIVPSGKMIALRPNPAVIEPYFLALALREKSSQHFLNERTTGMAESQVNFENQTLLNTLIKVPSPTEQKEITSVILDLDAEIDALVALREKTALIKIGMMQNLLTGEVRL